MDRIEIIERMRNCITKSRCKIDALLFIPDGLEWELDEDSIFGIPVFRASGLVCTYWGMHYDDCPFVPMFRFGVIDGKIRRVFAEAWDEWTPNAATNRPPSGGPVQ